MDLFGTIEIDRDLDPAQNEDHLIVLKALEQLAEQKSVKHWRLGYSISTDTTEVLALHLKKNLIQSMSFNFDSIQNTDHWCTCFHNALKAFKTDSNKSLSCLQELEFKELPNFNDGGLDKVLEVLKPFIGLPSLKSIKVYMSWSEAKFIIFFINNFLMHSKSSLSSISVGCGERYYSKTAGETRLMFDLDINRLFIYPDGTSSEEPERCNERLCFWLDVSTRSTTICDIGWFKDNGKQARKCQVEKFYPHPYPLTLNKLLINLERNRVGRALFDSSRFESIPKGFFASVLERGLKRPSIFDPNLDNPDAFAYDGIYYMIKGLAGHGVGRFGECPGSKKRKCAKATWRLCL